MYSFKNDYSEGAHPRIMDALIKNNTQQEDGYGLDRHSIKAVTIIQKLVGDSTAAVHLISGGTQTNLIAISAFLRPHEACITTKTGHIATHETGAIEATGHKLLEVEGANGKLTPNLIKPVLEEHHFEHMVLPRLVYISNPTELGTIYSNAELSSLSQYCRENDLLLYLDGARLGSALACKGANLTLERIYTMTDAFFIGGTKIGALLGEGLIVRNPKLRKDLRYIIKQRGALLAKGRILGIQFEELFEGDLYLKLAEHSNEMAQTIATKLADEGCTFLIDSPTNQIFPIMDNRIIDGLSKLFAFYVWTKVDQNNSAIRLVTSWATTQEHTEAFIVAYKKTVESLPAKD